MIKEEEEQAKEKLQNARQVWRVLSIYSTHLINYCHVYTRTSHVSHSITVYIDAIDQFNKLNRINNKFM